MVRELQDADIAVNPIVVDLAGSILNKVGDYAAAGLPVINTQESIEYRRLLDSYAAGGTVSENSSDVAEAIRNLVDNPQRRAMMDATADAWPKSSLTETKRMLNWQTIFSALHKQTRDTRSTSAFNTIQS